MKRAVIVAVFAAVVASAWTFLAAQSSPAPVAAPKADLQPNPAKVPEPPSLVPPSSNAPITTRPSTSPFGAESVAPTDEPPPPERHRKVSPPPDSSQPVAAEPTIEPVGGSLSPLQQRFIQLSTKKAQMLNPEVLQKAVSDLDREVGELNAWSRVEESARLLRDVAEKSPETAAGRAAKAALKVIEQHHSANELPTDKDERPFDEKKTDGRRFERDKLPARDSPEPKV